VNTEPVFSVIVPVYNTSAYIEKCLLSIVRQTEPSLEVIVIDDGSSDNSLALCKALALQFSCIQVHTKINEGQGMARNMGMGLARGEYIIFVDSDDWIDSGLLQKSKAAFEAQKLDFVNFGFEYINPEGQVMKPFKGFSVDGLSGSDIFKSALLDYHIYTSPCNKVYRRQWLLENNIQFPPLRAYEDVFFSRSVARSAQKTAFIQDVLYHILMRPGSTTRSMNIAHFYSMKKLFDLEKNHFENDLKNPEISTLFDAHRLKFMSHLLILAAFRIKVRRDFDEFHRQTMNLGFKKIMQNPQSWSVLNLQNKLMAKLSQNPSLLRLMTQLTSKLGFHPH
jgi:glycosyltransferase involved in cell wall biosynthesis